MKIPRYYRLPDGITLTYLGAFLYKIKLVHPIVLVLGGPHLPHFSPFSVLQTTQSMQ